MNDQMQTEYAQAFAALGHKSRVSIFNLLLACANSGCGFGALEKKSKIPASTLSHHLNELERGRIIERIPMGRSTLFRLRLDYLNKILATMMAQCCADEGER